MTGKLGLTSYAYYWATQSAAGAQHAPLTAWDLLDRTATLGLHVLQICEHVELVDWSADQLHALRDAAERHEVALEVGTRGLDTDFLKRAAQAAAHLGSSLLRIVPWSGQPARHELSLDTLQAAIDDIMPECRAKGITIAIENYFDVRDERLATFMEHRSDEYLGVCLDTANSAGLLREPLETARLLAPYAVSVHLKDFVVTKSMSGYRIAGAPLGQGWLDVQNVVDVIRATGRQTNWLLESWVEPALTREETIRTEDEWAQQSVGFARSHLHF